MTALTPTDLVNCDDLLGKLFAERGGRNKVDLVTAIKLEDYAVAVIQLRNLARRLEADGPVTQAGRRRALVDIYNVFSTRVERLAADLTLPSETPTPLADISPEHLIARMETLLAWARNLRDKQSAPPFPRTDDPRGPIAPAPEPKAPVSEPKVPVGETVPTPEPGCPYCSGRPCCGKEHDAYRTLHWDDPVEIERRRVEEMQRNYATTLGRKLAGIGDPEY